MLEDNGQRDLFNKMIRAGKRTYFINVRPTSTGKNFIIFTESRRGEDNQYQKTRVLIFPEQQHEILSGLKEATSFLV